MSTHFVGCLQSMHMGTSSIAPAQVMHGSAAADEHSAGLAMSSDGQCANHVVIGTKAGDCLFLDAAHAGQVMLCFPAHR